MKFSEILLMTYLMYNLSFAGMIIVCSHAFFMSWGADGCPVDVTFFTLIWLMGSAMSLGMLLGRNDAEERERFRIRLDKTVKS
jgi:hypothetical protein